ncbi:low affinity immunoglobulin gamma Fc region receptor II-like [Xenopus laevis]|uniref:low affinity immunoglobulin gamma Fc region receptor II-like n=1 Tax=Xenopus laevis TaxID=8355 RepID=UPI001BB1F6E7|nr:low affinity immunoglobulin gamma Fc region receptor II-like [Xenopus laevis]
MAALVLMPLLFIGMDTAGAAVRPVISLSPNWTPIFIGESVTLTCNVAPTAQGNLEYSWYSDGLWIPGDQQRLEGEIHSGNYQCQAGASERSEYIRLDVSSDVLILQAPPDVHEGDSLSLRCHSRTGYETRNTVFYKNNKIIESPVSESELHIGRVDVTASGTYKCDSKILYNGDTTYRNDKTTSRYISVSELFSIPQISVESYTWTEGDHMSITCDTKLSPHRETTELQFVFYRNGHNVQGFSLSNQYGVPSAQLEDSGNYTCEVQTPTGSVRKRSNVMIVEIQELFSLPQLKQFPDPVTQGENMTITCDTKLNSSTETTELQFAFYRNGHNVQGFNSSNQYGVPSAQLEHSGNYTCEVQTPTGSVRKRSNMIHIQIQDRSGRFMILVLSGVLLVVFLITAVVLVFMFRHKLALLPLCQNRYPKTDRELNKPHNSMSQRGTNEKEATLYEDPSELSVVDACPPESDEVCYTGICHTQKVFPIKNSQNDTMCVTYAVIQRDK